VVWRRWRRSVSSNGITLFRTLAGNVTAQTLASLGNLQTIVLDYTALNDAGVALLRKLPQLADLSIDNTNVTDKAVADLQGMTRLQSLNLYHTLVSEKGYEEIRRALPACKIVFDRDSALPNRRTR
jgi:hypothetical protein